MSIFKIKDFKYIENEANNIAKNIIDKDLPAVDFFERPELPEKINLMLDIPKSIFGEDMVDLQLNLAFLKNYVMLCNKLADGIKTIYDATCINCNMFSVNQLTIWLLKYANTYNYITNFYAVLNNMIEIIQIKSALTDKNNALNEHLNSLKLTVNDLRSSLQDKDTINSFLTDKNKELEEQLNNTLKGKKRTGRTNAEVAKIISDITKDNENAKHLYLDASTISRYNSSCKNGKFGKYQYPGNNAPLEQLQMWAIGHAMNKKQIEERNNSDEVQQKRFNRKFISLSNEDLDRLKYKSDNS